MSPETPSGSKYDLKGMECNLKNESDTSQIPILKENNGFRITYILLLRNNPKYSPELYTLS